MKKSIKWMGTAFAAALAITAITLALHGTDNKATRLALELTARFSFVLFWLAYAGGAMIFVISDEIIPETHRRGFETHGTVGLMIGLVVMMFLDVMLG